jgi:hypothetical protein
MLRAGHDLETNAFRARPGRRADRRLEKLEVGNPDLLGNGLLYGFLSTTFFASSASAARSMSSAGTSITSSDGGLTDDAGLAPGCAGEVREAADGPAECVLGALAAGVALGGGGLAALNPGTGRAMPASPAPRNAVTVGGRTHSVT